MLKEYNKLVRDKIPEICEDNGQKALYSVLNTEEYKAFLRKKLLEEVQEYLESEASEELADILEVVDALAMVKGKSFMDIIKIKEEKAAARGSFSKRIFLEAVDDPKY